jgi:hypothetical protein
VTATRGDGAGDADRVARGVPERRVDGATPTALEFEFRFEVGVDRHLPHLVAVGPSS